MKKAIMSVLTVWVLVSLGLLSLIIYTPEKEITVSAAVIIVDDDGTPGVDCNYTTIQEGIDAANNGDTVFVKNGTYYENVVVNKRISLIGEDRNSTIINGSGYDDVVEIIVDWVNVTGFTLTEIASDFASNEILLNNVDKCKIYNNLIIGNYSPVMAGVGVGLWESSYNIINNNIVSNYLWGFLVGNSANNNIMNNDVLYNAIGIRFEPNGNNNIIYGNNVSNNGYGIEIWESSNNNDIIKNVTCHPFGMGAPKNFRS